MNLRIDEKGEIIKRERCMNLKNNLWWNNQIIVTTLSKFRVSSYLMYFRVHTNHKYHNSLNDLIHFNDFADNLKYWKKFSECQQRCLCRGFVNPTEKNKEFFRVKSEWNQIQFTIYFLFLCLLLDAAKVNQHLMRDKYMYYSFPFRSKATANL